MQRRENVESLSGHKTSEDTSLKLVWLFTTIDFEMNIWIKVYTEVLRITQHNTPAAFKDVSYSAGFRYNKLMIPWNLVHDETDSSKIATTQHICLFGL